MELIMTARVFYIKITPKYWITLEISELEKILV